MAKEFAYDLDSINLDAMMPEDVAEFATHLQTLLEYARAKWHAMMLRTEGDVSTAQKFEDHCDALYHCLPSNWRW